jgi:hypothetical protein
MSTNSAILTVNKLDVNRVSFVVGQAKNGRNPSINIKYDGQNLQIRLPRMKAPGGVLMRENEKDGSKAYTLIGSLPGCDTYAKDHSVGTDDVSKFYNFLLDLEEKIVAASVEHSVKWFGKKRSEEAIRDGFKRLMRVSVDKVDGEYVPNGKYPPSFVVKVPVYDNKVSMDIIDNKGNPIYVTPNTLMSVFPKGVEANIVVSGSIYTIAGGGFGVTWRMQYAQVFPQQRATAANVFADDIEEDDEEDDTPAVKTETPAPAPTEVTHEDTAVDIEIPDVDEAPAPTPAPAAPARRRRTAVA